MAPEKVIAPAERVDELGHLKTQFLASLNHEIRTPLTGIMGMADLLLETRLDTEQKEYATTVKLCAEDLLSLLDRTLEFSHLAAGQTTLAWEEFFLTEALRSTVSAFSTEARAKGLTLACRLAPYLPDVVRLRQVLSLIVENAIKFTQRGKVTVSAEGHPNGGEFHLNLKVRDTGIGIPADKLVAAFESFRQLDSGLAREHNGLGLGLSLVRSLLTLMEGDIAVASEPGQGSVFSVTIPLRLPVERSALPAVAPPQPPETRVARGGQRILLVDDNEVAQRVVSHILHREGHQVCSAASGREAVAAASAGGFDLVLMDLQMPEMDGFETADRIRRLPGCEALPIIALTANSTDDYKQMCFKTGMQGFVPKPVRAQDLLSAVAGVLQ